MKNIEINRNSKGYKLLKANLLETVTAVRNNLNKEKDILSKLNEPETIAEYTAKGWNIETRKAASIKSISNYEYCIFVLEANFACCTGEHCPR